ncbi:MAG: NusG domain II-containing protein [Candidatus Heteroscillospira sp.]|jgi:hypothetical protein
MRFLRSTRFWVLAFAALILFSTLSMFFMRRSADGTTAVITQDGREIERIDLGKVKEPYTIRVDNPNGGYNIILVEKGQVSVTEASCPDKVCIRQGTITTGLKPIVCLPNKVMVIIEDASDDADSLAG